MYDIVIYLTENILTQNALTHIENQQDNKQVEFFIYMYVNYTIGKI